LRTGVLAAVLTAGGSPPRRGLSGRSEGAGFFILYLIEMRTAFVREKRLFAFAVELRTLLNRKRIRRRRLVEDGGS